MKVFQEKSAANYRLSVRPHAFKYIAARLGIRPEQLAWSLGYKDLKVYRGHKAMVGARALALTYLCAIHSLDVRDLLLEAEEAMELGKACVLTGFNQRATLLYLKMLGIQPLTKNPTYIRRQDTILMLSPHFAETRKVFLENPIRVWRYENHIRIPQAAMDLHMPPDRVGQIETGAEPTRDERILLINFFGYDFDLKLQEWRQKLRSARYSLGTPKN